MANLFFVVLKENGRNFISDFVLQGMMKGPESFLKHHKGVFVQASGTSFYEQCAPTSTVQFELSFTAMHWLRVTVRLNVWCC